MIQLEIAQLGLYTLFPRGVCVSNGLYSHFVSHISSPLGGIELKKTVTTVPVRGLPSYRTTTSRYSCFHLPPTAPSLERWCAPPSSLVMMPGDRITSCISLRCASTSLCLVIMCNCHRSGVSRTLVPSLSVISNNQRFLSGCLPSPFADGSRRKFTSQLLSMSTAFMNHQGLFMNHESLGHFPHRSYGDHPVAPTRWRRVDCGRGDCMIFWADGPRTMARV